jgi:small subunit ribosomal protein S3
LTVGQKTHPIGFRLGTTRTWNSLWFAKRGYARFLHEDVMIRRKLKALLYHAGLSAVEIQRAAKRLTVNVYTARPGIVIGKGGAGIEQLKAEIKKRTAADEVIVNIKEVRKAEMDAQLVAENVALQLERRVAFRRAMKKAMQSAMKFGAKGVKIHCSGRLGGAEMSRREWYMEGRVPLHTLRADIDYGLAEAKTTYGVCGVKVWIFRGEVLGPRPERADPQVSN